MSPQGLSQSLGATVIDGPLLWLLLISVAFLVATVLVRRLPLIRGALAAVETGRRVSIDGLRGLLGVSVFVHHTVVTWFFLLTGQWVPPPSRFIGHAGYTSVALFFMITAFLFWHRMLERREQIDWGSYIVGRLFRLYPAYLLMLMLVLVASFVAARAHGTHGPVIAPLWDWLGFTMFGTPDFWGKPATGQIMAWVTWSLRYEWIFYLSLPLLGFLVVRTKQPLAAALSAVGVLAVLYELNFGTFIIPVARVFLGGVVAAYWVRHPLLVKAARSTLAGLVAISALVTVVVTQITPFTLTATLGLSVFFVVIASGNDLWGLLRRPGLLWLGDITYSIYLLHGFFLWVIFEAWWPGIIHHNAGFYLGVAMLIDIAVILASTAAFLLIERPCIEFGRRLYRHGRQRFVPARAR
jgi:peptidoglycan/LPS O-acetylase OafA/YrhL